MKFGASGLDGLLSKKSAISLTWIHSYVLIYMKCKKKNFNNENVVLYYNTILQMFSFFFDRNLC